MDMFGNLRGRWMQFWFKPASPENLALCRILFFGAIFVRYLSHDFSAWADVSEVFWAPINTFQFLHLPRFNDDIIKALQLIWKVALLFSCIGLYTRGTTATAFVLGFYLLGLPHNMGKIDHYDAILVLVFAIMAFSRCGDALSVDRWRFAKKSRSPGSVQTSGEYTWPVRAVWLTLALIMFAAGVAKLRDSGLTWVFSDNVAYTIRAAYYHINNSDPLTSGGLYLAQSPTLSRFVAAFTLLCEIGYPLALILRSARWIIVPGTVLTFLGIRIFMGPTFEDFIVCHLFWVPWDRVRLRILSILSRQSTWRTPSISSII